MRVVERIKDTGVIGLGWYGECTVPCSGSVKVLCMVRSVQCLGVRSGIVLYRRPVMWASKCGVRSIVNRAAPSYRYVCVLTIWSRLGCWYGVCTGYRVALEVGIVPCLVCGVVVYAYRCARTRGCCLPSRQVSLCVLMPTQTNTRLQMI